MTKTSAHKTAVVIGATGLIGSNVVTLLTEAEHVNRVIVITRRPIEYTAEKIENHVIDFDQLSEHEDLFAADILFSCLGTTVNQAGSIAAQRVVDLDYQYTAARIACEQGVNHYLLVSSSGADQRSLSAYLKMKGELEAKVQGLAFQHISILQPSLLLGEREQSRLAESLASKVLPIICKLPLLRRYKPIDGTQVAQKMVMLSRAPNRKFERFKLDEVFPE
ncbi:MAG: hypothetical protein ACJAQ6_001573 [Arenicella sp.]|jgi:uncharacterized protein YbjT (DUF2867 family)